MPFGVERIALLLEQAAQHIDYLSIHWYVGNPVGDVPAYGIGSLVKRALDYGQQVARTGASNVGEYLAHERRDLVPRAEAQQFIEQVDALREAVDRIAARVERLEGARS